MSRPSVGTQEATVAAGAINKLRFSKKRNTSKFFNTAAVGREPQEAADEVESNKSIDWEAAVRAVQVQFARLLEAEQEEISVFHNTTAAVQRILLCLRRALGGHPATLLTTDAEYPGIITAAVEHWHGPLAIARIGGHLWRGDAARAEKLLCEAFLLARPSVVYLSHVTRATGYRLNADVITFMRAVNPRTVLVVDGAQATGNVFVGRDFLADVDFYVTSGHKWLSGRTALGLVCCAPHWHVADQAQGYSSRAGSAGTGSKEVLVSVSVALQDFNGGTTGQGEAGDARTRMMGVEARNTGLALRFAKRVHGEHGLWCVGVDSPGWRTSGLITVRDQGGILATWDWRRQGFEFTSISPEQYAEPGMIVGAGPQYVVEEIQKTGTVRIRGFDIDEVRTAVPPGGGIRVSMHYYHRDKDVDELADAFRNAARRR